MFGIFLVTFKITALPRALVRRHCYCLVAYKEGDLIKKHLFKNISKSFSNLYSLYASKCI